MDFDLNFYLGFFVGATSGLNGKHILEIYIMHWTYPLCLKNLKNLNYLIQIDMI